MDVLGLREKMHKSVNSYNNISDTILVDFEQRSKHKMQSFLLCKLVEFLLFIVTLDEVKSPRKSTDSALKRQPNS